MLICCVWKKKCHLISHFHLAGFMNLVFFVSRSHLDENKFHCHCIPICRRTPCALHLENTHEKTIETDFRRLTESALSMQLWYICDSSCV